MNLYCDFDTFESQCRCKVKDAYLTDTELITVIDQFHKGKKDKIVGHVDLQFLSIERFPRGLVYKFPNLVRMWVNYADIAKITREDLVGLDKLKTLTLIGNKITYLTEDVFDDLRSLTLLNLSNNFIRSIHLKTFDALTLLETLSLESNVCISKKWFKLSSDKELRDKAMEYIAKKCEKHAKKFTISKKQ